MFFVEIQGGIWRRGGGAHSHPQDIERNMQKHNDTVRRGFTFLQFSSDEVKNEKAIAWLVNYMAERGWRAQAMNKHYHSRLGNRERTDRRREQRRRL
jgi:hypothetical protein